MMRDRSPFHPLWVLLLAVACVVADPAQATRLSSGTTPGGAAFVIAAPDNWRAGDTLVIYNHGYGFEVDTSPGLGPLKDSLLARGYAVASSGFRQRGWALFRAMDDNAELLNRFSSEFGAPGKLLAVGGSMGGLVSLKMLDDARFSKLGGVYALCAPADPVAAWDFALDLRLAYDAICDGVTGGSLPRGQQPLPWALNAGDIPDNLSGFEDTVHVLSAALPITVCTGLGLNPALRSNAQKDRLAALKRYAQIDSEDFLTTNLGYAIFGLSELVRAPDKLGSRNAFDSRYVGAFAGSTATLDAQLPHYAPDLFARFDFGRSSIPGRIRNDFAGGRNLIPVVSLFTSRDELVRSFHASSIRGARTVKARIDESTPSHCGFSAAEAEGGMNLLTQLVAGAAAADTPAGQALQVKTECERALAVGLAGPCRIDPGTASAPGAGQPRTRLSDRRNDFGGNSQVDGATSGQWYSAGRSGEGHFLEILPNNTALVAWFTYPPVGAAGQQRWLFGTGEWIGNGVSFNPLYETSGARFGTAFDPAAVQRVSWGPTSFVFDGYDPAMSAQGRIRYAGPPAYGSGELPLTQLTHLGYSGAVDFNPPPPTEIGFTGTFWNPNRSGEGVFITQHLFSQQPGGSAPRIFLVWFTYDPNGQQMWLYGEAFGHNGQYDVSFLRPVGTRFGSGFDQSAVQRDAWGTATLRFDGCNRLTLAYAAAQAGFGSGTQALQRLTQPIGTESCPL